MRLERPHGLGGEGPPVHEEQHAGGVPRLHQAVNLVHRRERLTGAGRHRQQHRPAPVAEGLLDVGVRLDLIRPLEDPGVFVRGLRQPVEGGLLVEGQPLAKGGRGMELADLAGDGLRVPHVVVPDRRPVRAIEERHAEPADVVRVVGQQPAGVPLGLREHPGDADALLLRLDHPGDPSVEHEGVVDGAGLGRELLDGVPAEAGERHPDGVRHDLPPGRPEPGVDQGAAGFGFAGGHGRSRRPPR